MASPGHPKDKKLSLLDILVGLEYEGSGDVDRRILECLPFPDVQRMACAAKALAAVPRRHQKVMDWLCDLYLLGTLWPCRDRRLREKVVRAVQCQDYRILSFEFGAHDRPQALMCLANEQTEQPTVGTQYLTLYQVLEESWSFRFFENTGPWSFASVHHLDLEERYLERGEAFDDIIDEETDGGSSEDGSSEDEEGRHTKRQKRDLLQCNSKYCRDPTELSRVYHVDGYAYCGSCMDSSTFLKLQWCTEHYTAANTDWELQELPYEDQVERHVNNPRFWGLQDDEFMARLWYTEPYNTGELRFVGKGPRQQGT